MVSNLEDQLKQTSAQLSIAKDSALEREAEVSKVKLNADQSQRMMEDLERRLNRRAGELQASEEKCAQLARRIGNLLYTCHFEKSTFLCFSDRTETFQQEFRFPFLTFYSSENVKF